MSVLDFDIGIALLSEYDSDGFPTIQVDAWGEKLSGAEPYEQHSPHGILSRPHDPETDDDGNPGLGCQVLYALEGGRGHAWVSHDSRIVPLLPQLTKGGFSYYGGKLKTPTFGYIDGETNSYHIYIPYDIDEETDVPKKSMSLEFNVDNKGRESISLIHGSGAMISIVENDGEVHATMKNQKGDAYVSVNDAGVTINGQLVVNGGVSLGGQAGTPLVSAPKLIALLNQLITIVGAIVPVTGTGVPALQLLPQVAAIATQFSKGV